MAELEYKGIKIASGSKLFIIIPLISTLLGVLWGGMEILQRYKAMEEKINSYEPPDISEFHTRLSIIEEELTFIKEETQILAEINRDMKNDLRGDIRRIETIVEDTETHVKETSRELSRDLKELKQEMEDKINKAMNNPLNKL